MKLFIYLVCILISLQAIGQNTSVCYIYKNQYDRVDPKSKQVSLMGKKYFNSKMQLVKEVELGPGKKDSCVTAYWYDRYGNIQKEISTCPDTGVVGLKEYQYLYDGKGKITEEKFHQTKPFAEYSVTSYGKDSMVKKIYASESNERSGVYERKEVDIYNVAGRPVFTFSVNDKGDTSNANASIYLPLADTTKVVSNINAYINTGHAAANSTLIYLDKNGRESVIDYYSGEKYRGRAIKKYNDNRLVLEQNYSAARKTITSRIGYRYDKAGNLFQKKEDDVENKISKIQTFRAGKLAQIDFMYDNFLDHSIIYVCK